MTTELLSSLEGLGPQAATDFPRGQEEPYQSQPVSAHVIAHYSSQLDNVVEQLASHSTASLEVLRRAAYLIFTEAEEIIDPTVKELVRKLYAPTQFTEQSTRLNILDGGIGRTLWKRQI